MLYEQLKYSSYSVRNQMEVFIGNSFVLLLAVADDMYMCRSNCFIWGSVHITSCF